MVRALVRGGAVALLGVAALAGSAQAQQTIKIGAMLAVTGPASFLGDPEAKTYKLFVDKLNQEGGVLGRKLELFLYDTGGDAKQAVSFTKRLIDNDKIDILLGGTTTGETMAVIPMVDEAEIPFISLGGGNPVEPVKKWVFKTPHSDRMALSKIFIDVQKRGLKSVAVIAGSGGFDQSCRGQAKELAPKYGAAVVTDETYAPTDSDVTPQLTKIKNTAGVQAVISCGFGSVTSITARNYKQLGMESIPLYFNHGVGSQQFIDGAGGAAEGVRVPVAALVVAEQLADGDPQKPLALAYQKAYRDAYKEPISTFGGHAYDSFVIAIEAIKRAGGPDHAKMRDEIEKTKGFNGIDGIFNMSPTDHLGLTLESFKMVEVRNNGWKLLY